MNDEALQLQSFGATSVLPTLPVVIKNEKKCDRKSLGKESLEKVKMLSSCVCKTFFAVSTTSIHLVTALCSTSLLSCRQLIAIGVPIQPTANCVLIYVCGVVESNNMTLRRRVHKKKKTFSAFSSV